MGEAEAAVLSIVTGRERRLVAAVGEGVAEVGVGAWEGQEVVY